MFTIFKAGFLFSARAGSGVVIAKLEDGSESCFYIVAVLSPAHNIRPNPLYVYTLAQDADPGAIAWSAPSAIGTAGLGVGGQAGAEMTDFLVVLNSRSVSDLVEISLSCTQPSHRLS